MIKFGWPIKRWYSLKLSVFAQRWSLKGCESAVNLSTFYSIPLFQSISPFCFTESRRSNWYGCCMQLFRVSKVTVYGMLKTTTPCCSVITLWYTFHRGSYNYESRTFSFINYYELLISQNDFGSVIKESVNYHNV